MSTLNDFAHMLLDQVEVILADYTTCAVDVFQHTAGEPAAPSGQCSAISVWADQIFDVGGQIPFGRQGDTIGCVARPAVVLKLRVDVCYSESEQGPTVAEHDVVAECFYGLIQAVWCGLVEEWVAGTLLDQPDGRRTQVGDFQVLPRQGGIVSAVLDVTSEMECVAGDIVPPDVGLGPFDDGFDGGFE